MPAWAFVPILYFVQAVPVSLVQDVAPLLYKDLGVGNEPIVRWTSLIAIPWALQMMVGPMVDLNWTKRKWVIGGEAVMTALIFAAALTLHLPNAFGISLLILLMLAVVSTITNTAMDGFYLLALPKDQQALYVGVQSTCYRLGTLFCKGLLVILAGYLEKRMGAASAWMIVLAAAGGIYGLCHLENRWTLPRPEKDIEHHGAADGEGKKSVGQTLAIVTLGVSAYFACSSVVRLSAELLWKIFDGTANGPLKGWMLPDDPKVIGIPTHANGVLVEFIQLAVCLGIVYWAVGFTRRKIAGTEMGDAFSAYFRNKGIVWILAFLVFYRFGEAMVSKMSPLFLRDSVQNGGLGFPTETIGLIKGEVGVFGLVAGGLLGGWVVAKLGLRKCFWLIAICMHLPNLLYLWASYRHPGTGPMYFVDFCDQFGYGFGFAGYMIFQMSVARRGKYVTAHYALGVGIGALFIAVAGVFSGVVQSNFGWHGLFIAVIIMTIPGLLTLLFIPLDEGDSELPAEAA